MSKHDSDYRRNVRKVTKETPWTLGRILGYGFLAIVVIAVLYFSVQSLGIFQRDIDREVTQHSRQYIETKVNLLNKLVSDYIQLETEIAELRTGEGNEEIIAAKQAQQKAGKERIYTEAGMIQENELPTSVKTFMTNHPRYGR